MTIKNKRGVSFFVFDAVIAALIFFIAISSLLITIDYSNELESPRTYGENLINYYTDNEIRDLDFLEIDELINNNNITNQENTILEQMLVFHENGSQDYNLGYFMSIVSQGKVPDAFGLNISIDGNNVYSRTNSIERYKSLTNIRRLAFTKLDDGSLYGPKSIVVSIWY